MSNNNNVFRKPKRPEEASGKLSKKILTYIWSHPHAGTAEEIADACGCSIYAVNGVRYTYDIPAYIGPDGQKYFGSLYMF